MKFLLFIVSITLLLKPVFPVLEYAVNYNYIVTELCENKETPELQCNGKCHLAEELAKASENDTTESNEKKVVTQHYEVVYFQEIKSLHFDFVEANFTPKVENTYANNYNHLANKATFHPPTL